MASGKTGAVHISISTKIVTVLELDLALVCVGLAGVAELLAATLRDLSFESFDDVMANVVTHYRQAYDEIIEASPDETPRPSLLGIVGWSPEHDRFKLYEICAHDVRGEPDDEGRRHVIREAWTPIPYEQTLGSAAVSHEDLARCGITEEGSHDAYHVAVGFVAAARLLTGPIPDSKFDPDHCSWRYYAVGGFIELVDLRRGGYRREIVHRWPDRLFEIVDPDAGDLMPPLPITMKL